MQKKITRRNFLKLSGSALVAAAGSYGLTNYLHDALWPVQVKVSSLADLPPAPLCGPPQSTEALLVDLVKAAEAGDTYHLFFAGTDGWIYIPDPGNGNRYHPDMASPFALEGNAEWPNTYIFGFTNLTGIGNGDIDSQKMQSQLPAPLYWFPEGEEFRVRLTNLGLGQRPDLIDEHTIHFHGRRNVIPFFDGEPTTSIAVPIGRFFTYIFKTDMPGTYMYHCHVEEVEHVHLGMTGLVFVTPSQNGNTSYYSSGKYAYNCGDGSTGYDREYPMLLTEAWAEAHWDFSHVQLPEWSDYKPDYYLLNGRVYPDTLAPNAPSINPQAMERDGNSDLVPPAGRPELKYQPYSSLVKCNGADNVTPGDRVLLRFANLGYNRQSMTLAGIKMRVVGKDATLLRNPGGDDLSYLTDTLSIGPGESFDVIFEAPAYSGGSGSSGNGYDTYLLYNRSFNGTGEGSAFGGQMTEIHVYPPGADIGDAGQNYPAPVDPPGMDTNA